MDQFSINCWNKHFHYLLPTYLDKYPATVFFRCHYKSVKNYSFGSKKLLVVLCRSLTKVLFFFLFSLKVMKFWLKNSSSPWHLFSCIVLQAGLAWQHPHVVQYKFNDVIKTCMWETLDGHDFMVCLTWPTSWI